MNTSHIVAPNSAQIQFKASTPVPNQEMNKDMFMKLLVTQLQYQDPLKPMDNQEMLAQMAQFTALEQMKNVADITQKQYAHQMIGDFVSYRYKDEQSGGFTFLIGKVDYVKNKGNELFIGIGEHEVELNDIIEVYDGSTIQTNASAFELIGKTIQAVVEGPGQTPGTKENIIVEGQVLKVTMKDTKPYVILGTGAKEVEIELNQVQNIVEKPSLTNKYITATIQDENGETIQIQGYVEYIAIRKDETYFYVNGHFVPFSDLETIQDYKPVESNQ